MKVKVKVTWSCQTLCDPMWFPYIAWNSLGKNTGVGSLFPSPRDLLNLVIELGGLLHCRRILYQLSCQGSPKKNEERIKLYKIRNFLRRYKHKYKRDFKNYKIYDHKFETRGKLDSSLARYKWIWEQVANPNTPTTIDKIGKAYY